MENQTFLEKTAAYSDCYIAFLDLLGFKNIISQKECEDILQIFSKIKNPLNAIFIRTETEWVPLINHDAVSNVKLKIMSDSICFYIDASVSNAFCILITACLLFQIEMLKLPEPVLMRGGIVRGKIYARDDITFGPGLSNAYLLEEKSAKYPRIIVTGDVVHSAEKETDKTCRKILSECLYRDSDAFYILNYFSMLPGDSDNKNTATIFSDHIQKVLDSAVDPSIREKYLYLENKMHMLCAQISTNNS